MTNKTYIFDGEPSYAVDDKGNRLPDVEPIYLDGGYTEITEDKIDIVKYNFAGTNHITIKSDGTIEIWWADWGHSGGRVIKIHNKEDFDIVCDALKNVETSESFNFFNSCSFGRSRSKK